MTPIHTIVYVLWLLSEIGFAIALRSSGGDKKNADKGSIWILWVVILIAIQGAIFTSFNVTAPMTANPYFTYVGLAIIIIGILLRIYAIRSLGRMFTVDVTIREGHALKQDGIYGIIRHPSYSASLLTFLGFAMSLNNWVSLPVAMIPVFIAFAVRIRIEETALIGAFGNEYIEYKKRTKALVPFVY
jgi:protein-S-isoprenylcysteine O-methyltransferase Ste14